MQTTVINHVHFLFCASDAQKPLPAELLSRTWAYLGGVARKNGMLPLAVGGTGDHVHVLSSLPAEANVQEAARRLKSASAKFAAETLKCGFAGWQEGYGAFSVGAKELEGHARRIREQKEQHKTVTLPDELMELFGEVG
ncbi:MAG: transposase [Myxococcota bacterium]|jgi:REP element-mobilizing transposase RayT